jgi:hypothetical protein
VQAPSAIAKPSASQGVGSSPISISTARGVTRAVSPIGHHGRMTEEERTRPEDEHGEPGAEGGSEGSADTPPPAPDRDDDSPVGDTDQHSDASA